LIIKVGHNTCLIWLIKVPYTPQAMVCSKCGPFKVLIYDRQTGVGKLKRGSTWPCLNFYQCTKSQAIRLCIKEKKMLRHWFF